MNNRHVKKPGRGGARPGAGRLPMDKSGDPRTHRVRGMVTKAEYEAIMELLRAMRTRESEDW